MNLTLTEIRRSKLRFSLLTGAVSLLVFLVLLLTTLASGLVNALVGALDGLNAQGVVYSSAARDNIQASRLDPATIDAVARVSGVARASGVGTITTTAQVGGTLDEAQVFGFTPGEPGEPTALTSGRLPQGPNEVAIDGSAVIGDTITLGPQEQEFTVVGLLRGARFNALPTAYVLWSAYAEVVAASFPGLPFVPVNAVAFDGAEGTDAAAVAKAITSTVPGTTGYTRAQAVERIPGIESISQSFGILQGLTFLIAVVVIGFFFLILTVQKLRAITVLRAIGTPTWRLGLALLAQIALVVVIASVIATALTLGAVRGLNTGIPVTLTPTLIATVIGSVLAFAIISGLFSVRRLARTDPATATGVR